VTRADNTHHLRRAAAARHDAALDRARTAVEALDHAGETVTFTAVARAARVSRGWLYNQPDVRDAIVGLRRDQLARVPTAIPAAQRATPESLRRRLDTAREEISRLRAQNAALREQLARSLGERRARR
jgi:Family of unknown function (DUF6262)